MRKLIFTLTVALIAMSSCNKTQTIKIESIVVDPDRAQLVVGSTMNLTAIISPENATDKSVTWISDNNAIATVTQDGVVTGVAEGVTDIMASAQNGEVMNGCRLKVISSHKPVRPAAGNGWTITNVAKGLVLYTFYGNDPYSGYHQCVNVADIDTTYYALRLFYDGNRHVTSDVFKSTKAAVAVNGAYETTSIFIKVDGKIKKREMSATISDTGVPNWKNDGGVYVTQDGKVGFVNTIFRQADSKGTGSYGLTLKDQKTFYGNNTGSYYGIFSSAPLLVMDYDASFGTGFVPVGIDWSKLNSENPYRHQGNTNPRTVVADDCQGHILLIVADGRYTGKAVGFPAKSLTQFLVGHFDVRNALNMDGGGSTTMCVEGQGDATTHVVNHPCDSGSWAKPGEREVTSFFYVERKTN